MARLGVLCALLLLSGSLASQPTDKEATENVMEAINNDMQLQVLNGQDNAEMAYSDLTPYLGESKNSDAKDIDPWEAKTVAAIRGMSQSDLAVSTVTDKELQFAQDAEKAKDVFEQTQQMATGKPLAKAAATAADNAVSLAQAKEDLVEATATPGSWESLIETEESKDEEFEPELLEGTDADVEDEINQQIENVAGVQLGQMSHKKSAAETGLESFAKDAEDAEAKIQDMKGALDLPEVGISADEKHQAQKEAAEEAHDDAVLGDAQDQHDAAVEKLSASDKINKMLAEAKAKLALAQHN